jgi:hypothetical protein
MAGNAARWQQFFRDAPPEPGEQVGERPRERRLAMDRRFVSAVERAFKTDGRRESSGRSRIASSKSDAAALEIERMLASWSPPPPRSDGSSWVLMLASKWRVHDTAFAMQLGGHATIAETRALSLVQA